MGWFGGDKYNEAKYDKLVMEYDEAVIKYNKLVDAAKAMSLTNKELLTKIRELEKDRLCVEKYKIYKEEAEVKHRNMADEVENERFRANKSEREFELFKKDSLDAIEKLEEEVRGLQHDNKLLRHDNTELRNRPVKNDEVNALKVRLNSKDDEIKRLNEKIEELIEESNKPEPKPEQELEGDKGADEPEPSGAQEDFTCKVCGHEAKTLQYLKVHISRKKDDEHEAYFKELNEG